MKQTTILYGVFALVAIGVAVALANSRSLNVAPIASKIPSDTSTPISLSLPLR